MADYLTIAVINILVGFEIMTLGFLNSNTNDETVEALMIIAFLTYLVATILTVLIKAGDLAGNKIALIVTMILVFIAALFMVAGAAVWDGGVYIMTLDITGACLAVIGGIFLIVMLVNGGGSQTGAA